VARIDEWRHAAEASVSYVTLAAFGAAGIEVERVMTDNAWAYRSRAYRLMQPPALVVEIAA
jgi:hypothetical protein